MLGKSDVQSFDSVLIVHEKEGARCFPGTEALHFNSETDLPN